MATRDESKYATSQRVLVLSARTSLAKGTMVWIQGLVVWRNDAGDDVLVDDGSGIARVYLDALEGPDNVSQHASIKVEDYVLVTGEFRGRLRHGRIRVQANTIRNLSSLGPMAESLWHIEVVDAYLDREERIPASEKQADII